MLTSGLIEKITQRLITEFHPEKIILIWISCVCGKPNTGGLIFASFDQSEIESFCKEFEDVKVVALRD